MKEKRLFEHKEFNIEEYKKEWYLKEYECDKFEVIRFAITSLTEKFTLVPKNINEKNFAEIFPDSDFEGSPFYNEYMGKYLIEWTMEDKSNGITLKDKIESKKNEFLNE